MLCNSYQTVLLLPFVEKVYALEYDEEPCYDEIRFLLTKALLRIEMVPTLEYDWMT